MTKILVIEDEDTVRENILELLDAEGFDAIAAENGRIGLNLAQQQLPDLILCDVRMPELDGYGVLTGLQQQPITAAIPFIFLTAKAAKTDLSHGLELGATAYITKPFTLAELLGVIESQIENQ
jgi:CheY-like chemotaxis protein